MYPFSRIITENIKAKTKTYLLNIKKYFSFKDEKLPTLSQNIILQIPRKWITHDWFSSTPLYENILKASFFFYSKVLLFKPMNHE